MKQFGYGSLVLTFPPSNCQWEVKSFKWVITQYLSFENIKTLSTLKLEVCNMDDYKDSK